MPYKCLLTVASSVSGPNQGTHITFGWSVSWVSFPFCYTHTNQASTRIALPKRYWSASPHVAKANAQFPILTQLQHLTLRSCPPCWNTALLDHVVLQLLSSAAAPSQPHPHLLGCCKAPSLLLFSLLFSLLGLGTRSHGLKSHLKLISPSPIQMPTSRLHLNVQ